MKNTKRLALAALIAYVLLACLLTAQASPWKFRIIWFPWIPLPAPIPLPLPVPA